MTKSQWKAFLKRHPIFFHLKDAELNRLLTPNYSSPKTVVAGEIIVKQGEFDDSLYLIAKGRATVTYADEVGDSIFLDELGPDDYFGEIALLEHSPRQATVTATADCELLELYGRKFNEFMKNHADILSHIALSSTQRMLHLNSTLVLNQKKFEDQLDILNNKIDNQLQTVNTLVTSSQTVFEQINVRANEVIESAERRRTVSQFAGWSLTTIASIGVAVLGWFGIETYDDINERLNSVDKSIASLDKKRESLEEAGESLTKAIQSSQNIHNRMKSYTDSEPALFRTMMYTALKLADKGIEDGSDYSEYVLISKAVLSKGTEETIAYFFDNLAKNIMDTSKDFKVVFSLDQFLETNEKNTNKEEKYSVPASYKSAIYCYYLTGLLFDYNRWGDYNQEFLKFESFVNENRGEAIKKAVEKYFKIHFTALNTYVNYLSVPDEHKTTIKNEMYKILKVIDSN